MFQKEKKEDIVRIGDPYSLTSEYTGVARSIVAKIVKGHKVLFLPVHHPELNPIELVWSAVKNYCGTVFSNSTSFKEQRQHLEESLSNTITTEYCLGAYEHVREIEEKYWKADLVIDDDEIEMEEDDFELLYD